MDPFNKYKNAILDGFSTEGYKWDGMGLDWISPGGVRYRVPSVLIRYQSKVQKIADLSAVRFGGREASGVVQTLLNSPFKLR